MQCPRHPKVETSLCCGRCGRPICPKCSIAGPVGFRCPECSSLRSSTLYQIRPERFALAAVLGLAAGTVVGLLLQALSGFGFFIYLLLFIAPAIGGFVGDLILRASGRKRGLKLEILAGVSVVAGAVISQFVSHGWMMLLASPVDLVVYVVAVGLTASAAIGRIRLS